jgi:hypothetical protein
MPSVSHHTELRPVFAEITTGKIVKDCLSGY